MTPAKISIIEDNKVIRDNVSKFISFHEEFEVMMVHASVNLFFGSTLTRASQPILFC